MGAGHGGGDERCESARSPVVLPSDALPSSGIGSSRRNTSERTPGLKLETSSTTSSPPPGSGLSRSVSARKAPDERLQIAEVPSVIDSPDGTTEAEDWAAHPVRSTDTSSTESPIRPRSGLRSTAREAPVRSPCRGHLHPLSRRTRGVRRRSSRARAAWTRRAGEVLGIRGLPPERPTDRPAVECLGTQWTAASAPSTPKQHTFRTSPVTKR